VLNVVKRGVVYKEHLKEKEQINEDIKYKERKREIYIVW
jgi:hypothetical protein